MGLSDFFEHLVDTAGDIAGHVSDMFDVDYDSLPEGPGDSLPDTSTSGSSSDVEFGGQYPDTQDKYGNPIGNSPGYPPEYKDPSMKPVPPPPPSEQYPVT